MYIMIMILLMMCHYILGSEFSTMILSTTICLIFILHKTSKRLKGYNVFNLGDVNQIVDDLNI